MLDEPNASLDEAGEAALAEAIAAMRRHGSSLVLVTHKPAVLALTDKLLLLPGGRLQRFGATAEVLASASPPAAAAPASAPTRPTPAFGFGYRPGPGMPVGGVPGGAAR